MTCPARILIVEDEALVAYDLARRLTRLGYQVVAHAATGAEAVQQACALRPNIVLMDIRLWGEIDGVEAARAIQARMPIPIVYLSASTDAETLARIRASGAAGYLHKPVAEQTLLQTLRQVLSPPPLAPP